MDFILTRSSIKRFCYLTLVTCVSFVVLHYSTNVERHWIVWCVLTLSLNRVGITFRNHLEVIFFTGLSIALVVFLSGYIVISHTLLAIYLAILTVICVYVGQLYTEFFFSMLIVNIFAILAGTHVLHGIENTARTMAVLQGTGIAVLLQFLFWPYFLRNELRSTMLASLKQLSLLNREIFSCLLNPEYIDHLYLFERRLHFQKNRCLQLILRLEKVIKLVSNKLIQQEKEILNDIVNKISLLYTIFLDCAQLRRRVSDHTIFALCHDELFAIEKEIEKYLLNIWEIFTHQNPLLEIENLRIKITRLEESYQHVIQVAAREPLAFLLFLTSLKALSDEMALLQNLLLAFVKLKYGEKTRL